LSSAAEDVALRAQILATEHWSLLAMRGMTYSEIFNRAGIFLTLVSASVVALALVAQATDFGDRFYAFALLLLPVVLVVGIGTYVRVNDANTEAFWMLWGMNRLRHAYLELAPDLEPYFVAGHHDDDEGLRESMGPLVEVRISRVLASTPVLVGVVDAVLAGVLAGVAAKALDASSTLSIGVGAAGTALALVLLVFSASRYVSRSRALLVPRFPRADARS